MDLIILRRLRQMASPPEDAKDSHEEKPLPAAPGSKVEKSEVDTPFATREESKDGANSSKDAVEDDVIFIRSDKPSNMNSLESRLCQTSKHISTKNLVKKISSEAASVVTGKIPSTTHPVPLVSGSCPIILSALSAPSGSNKIVLGALSAPSSSSKILPSTPSGPSVIKKVLVTPPSIPVVTKTALLETSSAPNVTNKVLAAPSLPTLANNVLISPTTSVALGKTLLSTTPDHGITNKVNFAEPTTNEASCVTTTGEASQAFRFMDHSGNVTPLFNAKIVYAPSSSQRSVVLVPSTVSASQSNVNLPRQLSNSTTNCILPQSKATPTSSLQVGSVDQVKQIAGRAKSPASMNSSAIYTSQPSSKFATSPTATLVKELAHERVTAASTPTAPKTCITMLSLLNNQRSEALIIPNTVSTLTFTPPSVLSHASTENNLQQSSSYRQVEMLTGVDNPEQPNTSHPPLYPGNVLQSNLVPFIKKDNLQNQSVRHLPRLLYFPPSSTNPKPLALALGSNSPFTSSATPQPTPVSAASCPKTAINLKKIAVSENSQTMVVKHCNDCQGYKNIITASSLDKSIKTKNRTDSTPAKSTRLSTASISRQSYLKMLRENVTTSKKYVSLIPTHKYSQETAQRKKPCSPEKFPSFLSSTVKTGSGRMSVLVVCPKADDKTVSDPVSKEVVSDESAEISSALTDEGKDLGDNGADVINEKVTRPLSFDNGADVINEKVTRPLSFDNGADVINEKVTRPLSFDNGADLINEKVTRLLSSSGNSGKVKRATTPESRVVSKHSGSESDDTVSGSDDEYNVAEEQDLHVLGQLLKNDSDEKVYATSKMSNASPDGLKCNHNRSLVSQPSVNSTLVCHTESTDPLTQESEVAVQQTPPVNTASLSINSMAQKDDNEETTEFSSLKIGSVFSLQNLTLPGLAMADDPDIRQSDISASCNEEMVQNSEVERATCFSVLEKLSTADIERLSSPDITLKSRGSNSQCSEHCRKRALNYMCDLNLLPCQSRSNFDCIPNQLDHTDESSQRKDEDMVTADEEPARSTVNNILKPNTEVNDSNILDRPILETVKTSKTTESVSDILYDGRASNYGEATEDTLDNSKSEVNSNPSVAGKVQYGNDQQYSNPSVAGKVQYGNDQQYSNPSVAGKVQYGNDQQYSNPSVAGKVQYGNDQQYSNPSVAGKVQYGNDQQYSNPSVAGKVQYGNDQQYSNPSVAGKVQYGNDQQLSNASSASDSILGGENKDSVEISLSQMAGSLPDEEKFRPNENVPKMIPLDQDTQAKNNTHIENAKNSHMLETEKNFEEGETVMSPDYDLELKPLIKSKANTCGTKMLKFCSLSPQSPVFRKAVLSLKNQVDQKRKQMLNRKNSSQTFAVDCMKKGRNAVIEEGESKSSNTDGTTSKSIAKIGGISRMSLAAVSQKSVFKARILPPGFILASNQDRAKNLQNESRSETNVANSHANSTSLKSSGKKTSKTKITEALKSLDQYLKANGKSLRGTETQHFLLKIEDQHVLVSVPPQTTTDKSRGKQNMAGPQLSTPAIAPLSGSESKPSEKGTDTTVTDTGKNSRAAQAAKSISTSDCRPPMRLKRKAEYVETSKAKVIRSTETTQESADPVHADLSLVPEKSVVNQTRQSSLLREVLRETSDVPVSASSDTLVTSTGDKVKGLSQKGSIHTTSSQSENVDSTQKEQDGGVDTLIISGSVSKTTTTQQNVAGSAFQDREPISLRKTVKLYADPYSDLSHLPLDSSLLPLPTRNCSHNLSTVERDEKRAALERKYPLPPGVIIKSEPDSDTDTTDTNRSSSSLQTQAVSLFPQSSRFADHERLLHTLADNPGFVEARPSSDEVCRTDLDVGGVVDEPPLIEEVAPVRRKRRKRRKRRRTYDETNQNPPVLQPMCAISHTDANIDVTDHPIEDDALNTEPESTTTRFGVESTESLFSSQLNATMPTTTSTHHCEPWEYSEQSIRPLGTIDLPTASSSSTEQSTETETSSCPTFKATEVSGSKNIRIQRLKEMLKKKEQEIEIMRKMRTALPSFDDDQF